MTHKKESHTITYNGATQHIIESRDYKHGKLYTFSYKNSRMFIIVRTHFN